MQWNSLARPCFNAVNCQHTARLWVYLVLSQLMISFTGTADFHCHVIIDKKINATKRLQHMLGAQGRAKKCFSHGTSGRLDVVRRCDGCYQIGIFKIEFFGFAGCFDACPNAATWT
jgi:hypothetical protein